VTAKDKNSNVVLLMQIKREASTKLDAMKTLLEGLLIEMRSGQIRQFDTSDFVINEFRQLVMSLNALTEQLKRLP
jgi:hypothetical protein